MRHGPRVEIADDWFCEAAWDGEYERGDLDTTDIVTGSGGRLRDGGVTFVASGSTVDRLHSFAARDVTSVSNSLPCLLAAIGGEVDPTYGRYRAFFSSIVHGLVKYERWLPTSAGPVQLTYFDNLRWVGGALAVVEKPFAARTFTDFASYRGFLTRSMSAMMRNAGSSMRRHAIRPLGTLSSGYDSTTVAVVARQAGLDEAITVTRGFSGASLGGAHETDSGETVGRMLGLTCHPIEPQDHEDMHEVPFFAANGSGEDTHYLGATPHLSGRLLFTGYHGDSVWGQNVADLSANIVRIGRGGLSLTEFRLWVGFLHCPVPFWGVRAIAALNAISHSEEMRPWDVGGAYNRPICRRIIEEAGIPRDAFATRKRASAAAPLSRRSFLTTASSRHYLRWLRAQRMRWLRARRLPPPTSLVLDRAGMSAARFLEKAAERVTWSVATRTGWSALPHYSTVKALRMLTHSGSSDGWLPRLRRYVFPWAIALATARYEKPGKALSSTTGG